MINVLFLGDVFGRTGRRLVEDLLPSLVHRHSIDLVAANVENASGGVGLTIKAAEELFASGVDVMTSGNHIYRHKEIHPYLKKEKRIIRPANYPPGNPGRGSVVVETPGGVPVGLVNVMGRTFMAPLDCPFRAADKEVESLKAAGAKVIIVDVHAEATSEKKALGYYLDGRVAAVLGTHTHVQTADETILPQGTAYLSDLGMTGPHESVIGMKKETILERFLTGLPNRFEASNKGPVLEGAVLTLDESQNRAVEIKRIQQVIERPKI